MRIQIKLIVSDPQCFSIKTGSTCCFCLPCNHSLQKKDMQEIWTYDNRLRSMHCRDFFLYKSHQFLFYRIYQFSIEGSGSTWISRKVAGSTNYLIRNQNTSIHLYWNLYCFINIEIFTTTAQKGEKLDTKFGGF